MAGSRRARSGGRLCPVRAAGPLGAGRPGRADGGPLLGGDRPDRGAHPHGDGHVPGGGQPARVSARAGPVYEAAAGYDDSDTCELCWVGWGGGGPAGGPAVAGAAGGWALGLQPSAAPASAGWGSGVPPAPAVSVSVSASVSVPFFCVVEPCD